MPQKKPNRDPLTPDEMQEMQQGKRNSKIYKEISDEARRTELSSLTSRIREELSNNTEKIQLSSGDLETVKQQVLSYFDACAESGTLPSMIGVSRCLGYSRSGLYQYLDTHRGTPVAEFLEIARDAISDALDAASLQNCVNTIISIFIQKSIHQRIDRAELTISSPPHDPFGGLTSPEELRKKYMSAIPEGDYD